MILRGSQFCPFLYTNPHLIFTVTYTFWVSFFGNEGIETDTISVVADSQIDAMIAVANEINGVNSFADCLIEMELIAA